MRIVHSSHGKFHHHDLARQLYARGMLERFFTGYPKWKLRNEDLPQDRVNTFPWIATPYRALAKVGMMRKGRLKSELTRLLMDSFDSHVAAHMPECDAFIGLSGAALKSGRMVQNRGGLYVCDRGSSHVLVQNRLLREEFARQGDASFSGIDPRTIARELAEYDQADVITVPSEFVRQTFLDEGISTEKVVKVPYGVHLERFQKIAEPCSDYFDVVFVGSASFRKGIPDLLQAFAQFHHPRKRLKIVGSIEDEVRKWLTEQSLGDNVIFTGHCPQPRLKEILSRSHVMILPSIEEGLALVMAQALACGCPVIATENTGARDLFEDKRHGFIVPIRDSETIALALQRLADEPKLRNKMSADAQKLVRERLGGWDVYGEQMVAEIKRFVSDKVAAKATS